VQHLRRIAVDWKNQFYIEDRARVIDVVPETHTVDTVRWIVELYRRKEIGELEFRNKDIDIYSPDTIILWGSSTIAEIWLLICMEESAVLLVWFAFLKENYEI
jgi:hypothetical protein